MRIERQSVRPGCNLHYSLRYLDGVVQSRTIAFALTPHQAIADAHLPRKHVQPLSRHADVHLLRLTHAAQRQHGVVEL